jgi:CBS domain-containing protein
MKSPTDGATKRFAQVAADEICVGEVMHPGVLHCPPEAPLRYAAEMMARHRVHALVVVGDDEEGGVWGLVSDTDILGAIARGTVDGHTAGGMAQTPVVTTSRSESVSRAAELMREHSVTHLLVTGRGVPVGVISTLDLIRAVASGMADD